MLILIEEVDTEEEDAPELVIFLKIITSISYHINFI